MSENETQPDPDDEDEDDEESREKFGILGGEETVSRVKEATKRDAE